MSEWKWYVYIVECEDNLYYTGMTWCIEKRMNQHITKLGSKFTGRHVFKRLLYYEEYSNIYEARTRERQIKDWSRSKKEMLINKKWGK